MKYVFYRKKDVPRDRLICKKVDTEGNVILIQDPNILKNIINRFISKGYKPLIDGSNLYLYGKTSTFVLYEFPEILDCRYLKDLKESILSKIPEKKLVPQKENNKKGFSSLLKDFIHPNISKILLTSGTLAICALSLTSLLMNDKDLTKSGAYVEPTIGAVEHTEDVSLEDIFGKRDYLQLITKITDISNIPMRFSNEEILEDDSLNENPMVDSMPSETIEVKEPEITFEQKSFHVREKYYLTRDMLDKLLNCMCDNTIAGICYDNPNEALDYLYTTEERTYPEKMLIVMVREDLTYEQLDDLCAGVRAEGGEYYDECCRVASVGYNRYRSIDFNRWYGSGLYTQFLAPAQFSVFYGNKPYLLYKGAIDSVGYQAAIDTFFSRNIVTDYLSFKGSWVQVPSDWQRFMSRGNQFGNHQAPSDVLKLEYEYTYEQEMLEDLGICCEEVLPDLEDATFVNDNPIINEYTDDVSRNLTKS